MGSRQFSSGCCQPGRSRRAEYKTGASHIAKVKMAGVWFWQCCLWATLLLPWAVVGQHLGAGGLPGQRTPRTGAVWPPYEGAGQGYWARQAGFSLPFQQQQTYQPAQAVEQIQNTIQQQQFYVPQLVSGQTYWVPRQQQQQMYTEQQQQQQQQQIYAQQQQQLPAVAYTQAVELTSDQLRAQQRALMQKYLSSNEVLTTSTVHPKLLAGAQQNLYRFSTVDGSLTQVELQAAALP